MMEESKPERVVLDPLPRLLIYEHCPFCVRPRFVLGHKNVKHELVWLMNDDEKTPKALVGKKMVPIFQPDGAGGKSILESLDICDLVDSDERFGKPGLFRTSSSSSREDLSAWLRECQPDMWKLILVRIARAPLPEFAFQDARDAFVRNHPINDPASYEIAFARSPEYIASLNQRLRKLAPMIYSPAHCTEGGLSTDDIKLFAQLRTLTLVKGIEFPTPIQEYLQFHSERTEVPLLDYCAI